jgi:hypothetical protein
MIVLSVFCCIVIMVLIALIDSFAKDLIKAETTEQKIRCKNNIIVSIMLLVDSTIALIVTLLY